MNNNKLILFLVIAVIVVVGAYLIFSRPGQLSTPDSTIIDELLKTDSQKSSGTGGTSAAVSKEAPYGTILIEIKGFAYSAPEITIKAGTRVVWVNRDSVAHTVTSTTGLFDSGTLLQGQRYERTFDLTGVYEYKSLPHGNDVKGRIRVTN